MKIRLEDLEINNYKIYQDKDSFNFGIDAVLLANFALRENGKEGKNSKKVLNICDLCSGNLPIPLIMYAKRKDYIGSNINITAFEIEKEQVSLSNKSILLNDKVSDDNDVSEHIKVINEDIKNIIIDKNKYKNYYEKYDIITCNPPYIKKGSGVVNINEMKVKAKHEVSITFEEICKVSSILLKSNKKFFIIHHSERFLEISKTLKKYSFEIKKVQFVYPYINKNSNLCLIEAVKNAREGVKVLEPIIIYEKTNIFSKKVLNLYGK